MKSVIKGIAGVLLILLMVALPYYWENYGRELTMLEVVAFKENVEKNTVVEKDMLKFIKADYDKKVEGVITDPEDIIGLETKNYIPKDYQLVEQFFDKATLVLEDDEVIFKLPSDWIKAFPNSLRRGDIIYIYEVTALGENIYKNVNIDEKEPLLESTIAFVKDSSNREVITIGDKNRFDGSSKISDIEIICNQDMINKLYESVSNNNKFIIYYK